jgi:hypothetical protein
VAGGQDTLTGIMSHVVFHEQVSTIIAAGGGTVGIFPSRTIAIGPGIAPATIVGVLTNRAHNIRIHMVTSIDVLEVRLLRGAFFRGGAFTGGGLNPFMYSKTFDVLNYGPVLAGSNGILLYLEGAHADSLQVFISRHAVNDCGVVCTMQGLEEG